VAVYQRVPGFAWIFVGLRSYSLESTNCGAQFLQFGAFVWSWPSLATRGSSYNWVFQCISMYRMGKKSVLALNDGTCSQHRLTGYKKGTLIIWDTQKMAEFIRKWGLISEFWGIPCSKNPLWNDDHLDSWARLTSDLISMLTIHDTMIMMIPLLKYSYTDIIAPRSDIFFPLIFKCRTSLIREFTSNRSHPRTDSLWLFHIAMDGSLIHVDSPTFLACWCSNLWPTRP